MADGARTALSTKDVIPLIKEICQPVELGLQLGVEYSYLQKFEKDFQGDTGRQMIAVIDFWLKNSGKCSWASLAQAIQRCGGHDHLVSMLNQRERLSVSQPSGCNVESVSAASYPVIHHYLRKFKHRSVCECRDLGFSVAPADMEMIKGFSCRQLDTATYADVSVGCSNRPQGPTDSMKQLNVEEIMAQFSSLLLDVQIALETRQVKVLHVRQFFNGLFQGEDCIPCSSEISDVFNAFTKKKLWTYQHYSPLEKVVDRFLPSDTAIKDLIRVYKGHLSGYFVTKRLIDFIKGSNLPLADSHSTFPLKKYCTQKHYRGLKAVLQIDGRRISELSLMYVSKLWERFAEEFDLPLLTTVIDKIVEGSLIITWLVLPYLVDKILISSKTPKSVKFFRQHHIIQLLTSEGFKIYDEKQMLKDEGRLLELCCIQSASVEEVSTLLNHGVDPNVENECGNPALILACEIGQTILVRILIQNGANVNMKNKDGDTGLFIACRQGYAVIVEMLLSNGAKVDFENSFGGTPLHAVSLSGYADIAEMLVDYGAVVDLQTEDGDTALLLASRYGHFNVATLLVKNGADVNYQNLLNFGETALQVSSANGHVNITDMLIDSGAMLDVPTQDGETALILACQNGHVDVAKLLIQRRAKLNCKDEFGFTPLYYANQNNLSDVIKTLIDHGVQTETDEISASEVTKLQDARSHTV